MFRKGAQLCTLLLNVMLNRYALNNSDKEDEDDTWHDNRPFVKYAPNL